MLKSKLFSLILILSFILVIPCLKAGDYHDRGSWKKTLKAKAEYFEKNAQERHNIEGIYPSSVRLTPPEYWAGSQENAWKIINTTGELPPGWIVDHGTTGMSNVAHSSSWTGNLITAAAFRTAFVKKKYGENSSEYKEAYEREIVGLERPEKYSESLIGWVIGSKVEWDKVKSMHTLWNILHQYFLTRTIDLPESLAHLHESSKAIVVGEEDHYSEGILKEIGKVGGYKVILNEGKGKLAINLRDVRRSSHAGLIYVNFPERKAMIKVLAKGKDVEDLKSEFTKLGISYRINPSKEGWVWFYAQAIVEKPEDLGKIVEVLQPL